MIDAALGDLIVLLHLAYILFALLGGLLVLRWAWVGWVHAPAAIWAVLVELGGWYCPLTPLELWLRARAGGEAYRTGFVEHYLLPLIYPADLTRELQVVLGVFVIFLNVLVYLFVLRRRKARKC